jgi:hypothetical protein
MVIDYVDQGSVRIVYKIGKLKYCFSDDEGSIHLYRCSVDDEPQLKIEHLNTEVQIQLPTGSSELEVAVRNHITRMLVTEEMREAGSEIASALMDAQVSSHMGGLGGSKDWEEFESSHSGKNMDLIKQYVADEIDSVTAIYIAMHRESIISNDQETQGEIKCQQNSN